MTATTTTQLIAHFASERNGDNKRVSIPATGEDYSALAWRSPQHRMIASISTGGDILSRVRDEIDGAAIVTAAHTLGNPPGTVYQHYESNFCAGLSGPISDLGIDLLRAGALRGIDAAAWRLSLGQPVGPQELMPGLRGSPTSRMGRWPAAGPRGQAWRDLMDALGEAGRQFRRDVIADGIDLPSVQASNEATERYLSGVGSYEAQALAKRDAAAIIANIPPVRLAELRATMRAASERCTEALIADPLVPVDESCVRCDGRGEYRGRLCYGCDGAGRIAVLAQQGAQ